MKKLFALFLCAVLVLGCFAGCAKTETTPASSSSQATTPSQPSTPADPEYEEISIAKALELCTDVTVCPPYKNLFRIFSSGND